MSRLLDEALPLDADGRRAWLEALSPEHQDLAQALHDALLPGDVQVANVQALGTLPKFGVADVPRDVVASGLQPGARVGPYQVIRVLGAGGMAEVWLARRVPRLARIFLDGSPPQPMASKYSVDPVWSPDGKYFVYSGADVGTTYPLRASAPDGRPYGIPSLILTRGAHPAFSRNSGSLVILRGEYTHKNFWAWDPKTGAERRLTDLPSSS